MKYEADYVVVGAGAAGSVVAARLAEDGTRSVIVVEAGPDNTADPTIAVAARFRSCSTCLRPLARTRRPVIGDSFRNRTGRRTATREARVWEARRTIMQRSTAEGPPSSTTTGRGRLATTGGAMSACSRLQEDGELRRAVRRRNGHGKTGWLHIKRAKLERGFHPDLLHVAMQEYGMPFRHDFYNDPKNFAGIGWTDMQVHNDGRRSNAAVDLLLPTLEKTRRMAGTICRS